MCSHNHGGGGGGPCSALAADFDHYQQGMQYNMDKVNIE
jgi:hypothetical protein